MTALLVFSSPAFLLDFSLKTPKCFQFALHPFPKPFHAHFRKTLFSVPQSPEAVRGSFGCAGIDLAVLDVRDPMIGSVVAFFEC